MRAVTRAAKPCAACLARLRAAGPQLGIPSSSRTRLPSLAAVSRSILPQRSTRVSTVQRPFTTSRTTCARAQDSKGAQKKKVEMDEFPPERIRNLSIIAHIDHGKSTLADRLLQMTGTVPASSSPQFLDKLKVERERGITVKAQTVSLIHEHTDGHRYLINLIDTPGHVDFSYEVSRSLGACEGGLLLVDCSQGIQAQTLSVFHHALEADLTLLPVINKVDLPHASPEETSEQIESSLGLPIDDHMRISAKSGLGVETVLTRIVDRLPPPKQWEVKDGKLRGLIFDTFYDQFRGVVSLVRIFSGTLKKGDKVRFLQAGRKYEILEVGINNPEEVPVDELKDGQVGYLVCNMKNSEEAFIGDTICWADKPVEPLPGFKPMKAMVYAGVFPMDSSEFPKLEESIERLTLNDRSVSVQRESSAALSQGFRLGFLGTLHMDVFRQRLEDEYASEVIVTAPTVPYKVVYLDGREIYISNPVEFPDVNDSKAKVSHVEEPMINATIFVPNEYIGEMMDLCARYRGVQQEYRVLESTDRAIMRYSLPLSEIVTDFFSELKSSSSGFASFDYEEAEYEQSDLVKMNILINAKPIDALAMIVHRNAAQSIGKTWVKKLKDVLPRQQFVLSIQAAIGARVVARENLNAFRKDVTAGLYGGHYDRKLKHLNKQKEGKKRLRSLAGNIAIPQSAFYDVLSSRPRSYSTSATTVPIDAHSSLPLSSTPPAYLQKGHMLNSHSLSSRTSAKTEREQREYIHNSIAQHLPAEPSSSSSFPAPEEPHEVPNPIARHTLSPHERSAQLSAISRLTSDPPSPHATATQLHEAFTNLYDSSPSSHLFSAGELNEIISALRRLQTRTGGDRRLAHDQLHSVFDELRLLVRDKQSALKGLELVLLASESLQNRTVKTKDIQRAEKGFRTLYPTSPPQDDKRAMGRYKASLNHLLYLCALAGHEMRFNDWRVRMEREGLRADGYTWLAEMILLDKTRKFDEIPDVMSRAFAELEVAAEGEGEEGMGKEQVEPSILINFALWAFARQARWDVVIPAYSTLRQSSTDEATRLYRALHLESPFVSRSNEPVIPIPSGTRATQQTYGPLLYCLAREGNLAASLTILQHIFVDGHTPSVKDYVALFNAFAEHGQVEIDGALQAGDAGRLFPSGLALDQEPKGWGREGLSQRMSAIWAQGVSPLTTATATPPRFGSSASTNEQSQRGGEWTTDVLEDLFESFLSLRPDPQAGDRAPNRKAVYLILKAFAKTSGGEEEVVRRAWEAMESKFGPNVSPATATGVNDANVAESQVGGVEDDMHRKPAAEERETNEQGWKGWKDDGRLRWLRYELYKDISSIR